MSVEKQIAAVKLEIEQLNTEITKYKEMKLDYKENIEKEKLAKKSCQLEILTAQIQIKQCEMDMLKKKTNGFFNCIGSTYLNGKILQLQMNNDEKKKPNKV